MKTRLIVTTILGGGLIGFALKFATYLNQTVIFPMTDLFDVAFIILSGTVLLSYTFWEAKKHGFS